KNVPGVRFVTARELLQVYGNPSPPHPDRKPIAVHMAARQTFLETSGGPLSAADMLLALLGMDTHFIEGPVTRATSSFHGESLTRHWIRARSSSIIGVQFHESLSPFRPTATLIGFGNRASAATRRPSYAHNRSAGSHTRHQLYRRSGHRARHTGGSRSEDHQQR